MPWKPAKEVGAASQNECFIPGHIFFFYCRGLYVQIIDSTVSQREIEEKLPNPVTL